MNAISRPPVTLEPLRAVWISDLHLDSKPCKAAYLLDCLNTIQNQQTVAQYAVELGCDGVICGHIHKAELKKIAETLYLNDGDWVESCTAIVETQTGWFELLHWADRRERLQSCQDLELAPNNQLS